MSIGTILCYRYIQTAILVKTVLQRSDIVLGSYEPSDKECEWNLDEADDDGAVSPKIVEIKEDGETAISGLTVSSCTVHLLWVPWTIKCL